MGGRRGEARAPRALEVLVPALLEQGRRRAEAEGLTVRFQEADAEELPFADGSFDVVLSTFGVMFTADAERAASELVRVCRPGGRIGLANWTPDSFVGRMFRTLGRHVPPPSGVASPALWGTRARLDELFGAAAAEIDAVPRRFVFRYRSAEHFLSVFRTWYGPMNRAFAALDPERQAALSLDLLALAAEFNRSGDATLVVPSDYLEVVIETKR